MIYFTCDRSFKAHTTISREKKLEHQGRLRTIRAPHNSHFEEEMTGRLKMQDLENAGPGK